MTDRLCPLDHRGVATDDLRLNPGSTICNGCTNATRVLLRSVPDALDDLDVQLSRQGSRHDPSGHACPDDCDHDPDSPTCRQGVSLDVDEGASQAALALVTVLHGWARVWDEETPAPCRRARDRALSSPRRQALALADVPDLGSREWAPDLAAEITAAVAQARRACDGPEERTFVGWCPGPDGGNGCGRALYARQGAARAACPGCGSRWDVEAGRAALMAALPGVAELELTKPELAVLLGVPVGTLHRWSSERRILPCGVNAKGQPTFVAEPVIAAVLSGIPPDKPAPRSN